MKLARLKQKTDSKAVGLFVSKEFQNWMLREARAENSANGTNGPVSSIFRVATKRSADSEIAYQAK